MIRDFLSSVSFAVIIPAAFLILAVFIITNFFIKHGDYLDCISKLKQTAIGVRASNNPQNLEIISSSSGSAIAISTDGNLSVYGNLPFSISELTNALVKDKDEEITYLTLSSHNDDVYYICKFQQNGRLIYIFKKSGIDSFRPVLFPSIISFLTLLTLFFFYILYHTNVIKPLQKVLLFADKLISGDYSFRINEDRHGEVFSIIRKMNLIADKIDYQIYCTEIEKKKLNDLFTNISDALAFIDKEGYLITSNNSFKNIFSITSDSAAKYYDSIRNSEINAIVKKTIDSKNETNKVIRISGKTYETLIKPVFYGESFYGLILSMRDITEKNKIDLFKKELVGNLSHELKTPITIAKGYLETIQNIPDDNPQRIKFIDKTIANLNRQNAIIIDMLKLNMLETANVFDKETVNIKTLISNIIDILSPKFAEKEIIVEYENSAFDFNVKTSRFLAEQVFFNIIDNAASYNIRGGRIIITNEMINNYSEINIKDTGIGIPDELRERIFERFFRVDKARSRETGGTGLGLSIVKHCLEILNWDINVKGASGNGSEFIVKIPLT
ncbi:MAG: hypothetical protein KA015_04900 [Spirochaetes bacterium]|nr:hypothetical protein [Spirochaetota bacterium]